MASKVFIDANILLDLTLKRGNHMDARQLIGMCISGGIRGFITPSILNICSHWLSKSYGAEKAKTLLLALLMDITIIDTSHDIVLNALQSSISDIEDALQYYTALHHKIDYFITGDKKLKSISHPQLPIVTPAEFLANF